MAKAKITKNVDEIVKRWQNGLANASETITNGVKATEVSPGKRAAAAKDAWVRAMQSKEVQDRWANEVGKVTLEEWQQAMINKGIPNITNGVNAAAGKMTNFYDWLVKTENEILNKINAMPELTLEQRIQRAVAWMKAMNSNPYKGYKRS